MSELKSKRDLEHQNTRILKYLNVWTIENQSQIVQVLDPLNVRCFFYEIQWKFVGFGLHFALMDFDVVIGINYVKDDSCFYRQESTRVFKPHFGLHFTLKDFDVVMEMR